MVQHNSTKKKAPIPLKRQWLGTRFSITIAAFILVLAPDYSSYINYENEIYRLYHDYSYNNRNLERFLNEMKGKGLQDADDYYVIEGDLLLTEEEIQDLYRYQATSAITGKIVNKTEGIEHLLINSLSNGELDIWPTRENIELSYAIQTPGSDTSHNGPGFSQNEYDIIVKQMKEASAEWNSHCINCSIYFKHDAKYDGKPSHENVDFIVRKVDVNGRYIATSFYPSFAQQRRYINIDGSFFNPGSNYDQTSVIRHLLGHVLGYRHQHVIEPGECREAWTEYTPIGFFSSSSVMHHLCEGTQLELTSSDKEGHQRTYASTQREQELNSEIQTEEEPTNGSPSLEQEPLVKTEMPDEGSNKTVTVYQEEPSSVAFYVKFQGGERDKYITKVLQLLRQKKGLIKSDTKDINNGDTICGSFIQSLTKELGCNHVVLDLADGLNIGSPSINGLKKGEVINVPKIRLKKYIYTELFYLDEKKDEVRLKNILNNWNNIVNEDLVRKKLIENLDNILTMELHGLELQFLNFSKEDAKAASKILLKAERQKEILPKHVRFGWTANAEPVRYSTTTEDNSVTAYNNCQRNNPKSGRYSSLVYSTGPPSTYTNSQCVKSAEKRPEVIVIDTEIARHPDLLRALSFDTDWITPGRNEKTCSSIEGDPNIHHGTHLACIIACENDADNNDFTGICPNAKIENLIWTKDVKEEDLQIKVNRLGIYNNHYFLNTYLFASDFPTKEIYLETPNLLSADARIARHMADKELQDLRALVITAAGQPLPGINPKRIHNYGPGAPRNRGNVDPYVVVVTACENCNTTNPIIYSRSNFNYHPEYVHVAAPGTNINGLANETKHTTMTGTSQAAAYVAGLASAMIANDKFDDRFHRPIYYRQAKQVKIRLQVTSQPFPNILENRFRKEARLPEHDNRLPEISGGVVDVNLALLDPSKNWIKYNDKPWRTFKFKGWCNENLDLSITYSEPQKTPSNWRAQTRDIYRISSWISAIRKKQEWIVYKKKETTDDDGVIRITGPGQFTQMTPEGHPVLVMYRDETNDSNDIDNLKVLYSNYFTDIILRKTNPTSVNDENFSCEKISEAEYNE